MICETKTSNLMNDYFGYYTKSWERSNWKIEWRRKRKLKVSEGSCRNCLPCFIAVFLNFDQRWLGNKDTTNNKKEIGKNPTFSYLGAETSRAEMKKGRNLWGSNPKRAETSGILYTRSTCSFQCTCHHLFNVCESCVFLGVGAFLQFF